MEKEVLETVEEIQEETQEEKLRKTLDEILEEHPELKEYAVFDIVDEEIKYNIDFDYKTFNIAHENYFYLKNNPSDKNAQFIDKFLEDVYKYVQEKCNEGQTHRTAEANGRYFVCLIEEYEKIIYESMSDEEKAEYNLNEKKAELYSKISEQKAYLDSTDYILPKIQEVQLIGTEEELSAIKEKYAEQLANRQKARVIINECEKELESLS